MKIDFEQIHKVPSFKTLKQPGILSFDRVFINALNLGCALIISEHRQFELLMNAINCKIDEFEQTLKICFQYIDNEWWKNDILNEIDECRLFLKKCISTSPSTYKKVFIFLKANCKILCKLSSIWILTNSKKKPSLCETRKNAVFNIFKDNDMLFLLSDEKMFAGSQEFVVKDKRYYSLLPIKWDVVDYFIWIAKTNYWTKYWRNFQNIFDNIDHFGYDEIIVKCIYEFDPNSNLNVVICSNKSCLAFNYVVESRGCKTYKENFNFVNNISEPERNIIHDCINGYYLINEYSSKK